MNEQETLVSQLVHGRECISFLIKRVFWWVFRLCTRLVLGSVQIQQLHSICSQKFVLGGERKRPRAAEGITYANLVLHVASHFVREGRSLLTFVAATCIGISFTHIVVRISYNKAAALWFHRCYTTYCDMQMCARMLHLIGPALCKVGNR